MFHAAGSENARDEFGQAFKDKFPAVLKPLGKEVLFSRGADRSEGDEPQDQE